MDTVFLTVWGVVGGVLGATGREPRDFTDYARRTAATGVWSAG